MVGVEGVEKIQRGCYWCRNKFWCWKGKSDGYEGDGIYEHKSHLFVVAIVEFLYGRIPCWLQKSVDFIATS